MGEPLRMRRADFWTSLVLFGLALGMIRSALTMPLRESFAGVQNVWYVSPALFPLLIAGGLLLLATALLRNAIRTGGARAALAALGRRSAADATPTARMLAAIALIAGYVYGLIPRVDYLVATALFLQVFIGAFYLGRRDLLWLQTGLFLAAALPAFLAGLAGWYPAAGTWSRWGLDGAAALFCLGIWRLTRRRLGQDPAGQRRLRVTIAVGLVVAFATSVAFKFGLLVPLPAEGAAVRLLESIHLSLRPLWS
jgi:hypothetical protein